MVLAEVQKRRLHILHTQTHVQPANVTGARSREEKNLPGSISNSFIPPMFCVKPVVIIDWSCLKPELNRH